MDIDARAVVTLVKPEATVSHTSLKSTISTVRMESVATLADGSLNKWIEDFFYKLLDVAVYLWEFLHVPQFQLPIEDN